MDGTGLVLGIPGLIQSCVHGYKLVSEMLALDANAQTLRLRCRVEESRLALWGRFWGLVDEQSNVCSQHSHSRFDDLLELPGIGDLIIDILNQIKTILEKTEKLSNRYAEKNPVAVTSTTKSGVTPQPTGPQPTAKTSRGIPVRLRWALKDKESFEDALVALTSLNDGLDKLLPRHERITLERALVGELLAEPTLPPGKEGKDQVASAMNPSTKLNREANTSVTAPEESHAAPTTPSVPPGEESSVEGSMLIPIEWFPSMEWKTKGRSVETMEPPPDSKLAINSGSSSSQPVLVEWRSYSTTVDSEQLQLALAARREEISRLFSQEPSESSVHYVLSCLGYVVFETKSVGLKRVRRKRDDGYPIGSVGFVFRVPNGCHPAPTTLHDLMKMNYDAGTEVAPDLNVRFKLARKLSLALYQLQCSGWLHRQFSSHNILFFSSSTQQDVNNITAADLMRPYIAGWQTSRQDDQRRNQETESGITFIFEEHEKYYIHPNRPTTRFKRSYDIYSLGVVLAEIAFWEPFSVLGLNDISGKTYAMAELELGAEVGRRYRDAVLWCLKGLGDWQMRVFATQTDATEEDFEREIGLEKEFFWGVLNELSMDKIGDSTRIDSS